MFADSAAATGESACSEASISKPGGAKKDGDGEDSLTWALEDNVCKIWNADCTTADGSSARVNYYPDPDADNFGFLDGTDVNVHDLDEAVYCSWNVCQDDGTLRGMNGLFLGSCPDSAESC